jgi:hypothetical protein
MVKTKDALWDARGVPDPVVAAARTQCSRSPAQARGKKSDKRGGGPHTKKSSFFLYQFFKFLQPQQWHVQVSQLLWTKGPQVCGPLLLVGILKSLRAFNSSVATRAHATAAAMHFSADAGLIFLKE